MKKNILIFCTVLAAFCLMAFSYMNWNNDKPAEIDLVYNIGSRFGATVTKEELHKAKTVDDITPERAEWDKITFLNMRVTVMQDDEEITALGENEVLNAGQAKLLQAAGYSTNFYMTGRGKRKGAGPEGLMDNPKDEFNFAYYFTIVPEKEAEYVGGIEKLISYLKKNSKKETAIITEEQLKPCQINFTITKNGSVAEVTLNQTSGFPSVDNTFVKLLENMPGKWRPAKNGKGKEVDQELVFFFGRQGC
ncbi:MAG: hypothetical protein AAFZ15_16355 [Bacteroidota bacterium]